MSEYAGVVDALPPEIQQVMRGGGGLLNGPLLYNGFQQHRANANGGLQHRNVRFQQGQQGQQGMEQQQPVVHAPTSNPLSLFLQTLMPWQPTPNAPPVQQQQQGQNNGENVTEWVNNLVNAFNAMRSGNQDQNGNQPPPPQ